MDKKLFGDLVSSLKEMKAVQAGKAKPGRRFSVEPAHARVPAIRRSLGLSQTEFAAMLGISVKTLRHWEQGDRSPDGPARALLTIAAQNPRAVLDACTQRQSRGSGVIIRVRVLQQIWKCDRTARWARVCPL